MSRRRVHFPRGRITSGNARVTSITRARHVYLNKAAGRSVNENITSPCVITVRVCDGHTVTVTRSENKSRIDQVH